MTIATGTFKQLRYKKEVTLNTAPGATGAQLLRRVTSNLALKKQTYQSKEIRPDLQRSDFRHGARAVDGTISGELSVGTYQDFMATMLRQLFTATTPITGVSLTIAGTPGAYTVTRAAGSFLTDGVKIGDVIQLSVGTLNAANISKNLLVIALTATVATVTTLNASTMVAEGPITGCTVTVMGKKSWVPTTGHTNDSYSIEHWHSDIAQSELFTGCRLSKADIKLPATGMATCDFAFMGLNITTGTAAYYTSPTAASGGAILAAVNGAVYVGGVAIALITGIDISLNPNMTTGQVVGSNVSPDIFAGSIDVTGQMTVYFADNVMRDYFVNETEVTVIAVLTADNTANSAFQSYVMSRVKMGGASKDDGEKGLIQTMPFTALLNGNGGATVANLATTLSIQDSAAV